MHHARQVANAHKFLELHRKGDAVLLANAWSPGSAAIVESLGYEAVATTSSGISFSLGQPDGEGIPIEQMLGVVRSIVNRVAVPVTADIEGAYGSTPDSVFENVKRFLDIGVAGLNIEDSHHAALLDFSVASDRYRAARESAEAFGVPVVINSRIDTFLYGSFGVDTVIETISRARAYTDAGVDCVFIPGISSGATIRDVVKGIDSPVNVLAEPNGLSVSDLNDLDVARISVGGNIYQAALGYAKTAMQELKRFGTQTYFSEAVNYSELQSLFLTNSQRKSD